MSKNIRFLIHTILAYSFYFFSGFVFSGNEDRQFEVQRIQLANRIEKLLIDHGQCNSTADCRAKKMLSISPGAGGLDIQIYSIKSGIILKYIFGECLEIYLENTGKMGISINAYEITKDDSLALRFWQSSRPIFSGILMENK